VVALLEELVSHMQSTARSQAGVVQTADSGNMINNSHVLGRSETSMEVDTAGAATAGAGRSGLGALRATHQPLFGPGTLSPEAAHASLYSKANSPLATNSDNDNDKDKDKDKSDIDVCNLRHQYRPALGATVISLVVRNASSSTMLGLRLVCSPLGLGLGLGLGTSQCGVRAYCDETSTLRPGHTVELRAIVFSEDEGQGRPLLVAVRWRELPVDSRPVDARSTFTNDAASSLDHVNHHIKTHAHTSLELLAAGLGLGGPVISTSSGIPGPVAGSAVAARAERGLAVGLVSGEGTGSRGWLPCLISTPIPAASRHWDTKAAQGAINGLVSARCSPSLARIDVATSLAALMLFDELKLMAALWRRHRARAAPGGGGAYSGGGSGGIGGITVALSGSLCCSLSEAVAVHRTRARSDVALAYAIEVAEADGI
jgi:hypothetical protein